MIARSVVCVGILVVDVIGRPIDAVPPRGALQLVDSISMHIGGCAANTGIGLQKLGLETRVVGACGDDGFGDFVRQTLENCGVTAQITRKKGVPTSATMVLGASDGERSFLHCAGANAHFSALDFDDSLFDGATCLHIAGHGLMSRFDGAECVRLLKRARERGLKTSLDTAGAPDDAWTQKLRETLPYLDYFVPSLHEVQHLFPDATSPAALAARLLESGVGIVALKMGERGSFVTDGTQSFHVAPISVSAVDATGAGDAFAAGFLCGVLNGFSLEESAQLGNATGALCVTQVGTIAGYKSLNETLAFMKSHSPNAR